MPRRSVQIRSAICWHMVPLGPRIVVREETCAGRKDGVFIVHRLPLSFTERTGRSDGRQTFCYTGPAVNAAIVAHVRRFITAAHKPPVLWVRGANDQIVSDSSLFEFGTLGKLGAVPGWPGEEIYPPQPMVGQTRAVLGQYAANGGAYREAVLDGCGHSPYVVK